jgi:hypothetical protein
VPSAGPPLLLAVVDDLGHGDLAGLGNIAGAGRTTRLTELPRDPRGYLCGEGDASESLRDRGIAVDRSSLLLARDDSSASAVLGLLERRPTGPAPVTLLALRLGPTASPAARQVALAEFELLLAQLRERLRRGDLAELWLAGLGATEPVHTTFDFAAHWLDVCRWPLKEHVRTTVTPGRVIVRAADAASQAQAQALLALPRFTPYGDLAPARRGELAFAARPGIAFGRQPVVARRGSAPSAAALSPQPVDPWPEQLPFVDWLARFWLRAHAVHGIEPTPREPVRRVVPTPLAESGAWTTPPDRVPVGAALRR